ncbi:MAG: hypothetical protein ABR559_00270 [Gemmatimonadota bacterium]
MVFPRLSVRTALLALVAGGLWSAPAVAQEIVQPRAPVVRWRPAPSPAALATRPVGGFEGTPLPAGLGPRYDPWLGAVTPPRAAGLRGGDRLPGFSGADLTAYVEASRARERARLWNAAVAERLSGRARVAQGLIPEFENPLKIPRPLARVFGEGSEFDVQGKLHLSALGARSRQEPDLRSELLRRTLGGFDLDLEQILDLKILGTVGTKLDVAVDFNSARELDSKQLISAAYTGTEDEILRKIEVGDVRVQLPPSRFLGAGVARGTFGAQAIAQLGPLDLRFLGSKKEGQSTVRSLSIAPQGGGILQEVTLDIKDTQYQDDKFFLLFHPDSLVAGHIAYPNPGTTLINPASAPADGTLNLWLDDGNFTNNRELASKPGIARVNPTTPGTRADEEKQGNFDLLIEGDDYVLTDGIVVQLKRQLNDAEILAVSYVTREGTAVGSPQGAEELDLKLIKSINPDTVQFTWDYTLRNIYSLRESNIEPGSLGLTIYRGNQDLKRTFETLDGVNRTYSEIFGVADANNRVAVPRLLRDPFGGPDYLVLPNVRPFFQPTTPDGAPIPIERPNRRLYFNSDTRRTALDDQIYFIEAAYQSRGGLSGEIELGASNIIEGSEQIAIGAETLTRGEDYQIFYDFGKVVFSDPAGLAERHPNDRISIAFEVAPLFNLAPTTLWGAAGTYALGQRAAINSTLLVQRQESLANRPILGAEPTRTLIAEIDGVYARPLPILTRWLDALPGVDTEALSDVSLRGELAWSQPNPNTEGRVFLNDFESIEVAKRLSLFFRSWAFASRPTESDFQLTELADLRWFTFAAERGILPGQRGVNRGENVFAIEFQPRGDTPGERERSWRSIQTILSTTGEDITRQEFVEFFVQGESGTLVVDLGTIDEDAVRLDVNGAPVGLAELDTEEINPNTRDNNLDVDEDVGLDGVEGSDFENVPGDDGNDDFDQTFGGDGFPINPNGTENNTTLDTEDNNFNGLLDRQEDVLRWEVDLRDSRYEVPGSRAGSGYRQIRLPLVSPDAIVGSPDLRNVRTLRVTVTGVERGAPETLINLARLEIVGSTFLKRGIVAADGTVLAGAHSDSLQIAAINDAENPVYESPPGVVAEQDRADQVAGLDGLVQEQSLELFYRGLPPGARGTIFRPLFDRESYIDYHTMRIFVQGRPTVPSAQPDFFVAFGLDTLNVYEYAAPLRDQEWEEHVIDFTVFTALKAALLDSLETAGGPRIGTRASADGRYRVRIGTEDTPPPTLTEVSQLTIGVENSTGGPLDGSFWVNEWRLTEPVREGGAAHYVDARTTLADLGELTLTYENRGGRYRGLSSAINNFSSGILDVSALVRLEKFLPEAWGIALPLTYDRYGRRDAPVYEVGSDILLDGDGAQERVARTSAQNIITVRAYRARESSNPWLAATLDRLEARLTYRAESFGSVDLDTDRGRWDTSVGYQHGFRQRPFSVGLGWLAELPWPGAIQRSSALQRLATAKLNLVPATVSLTAQTIFEDRTLEKTFADTTDFTADTTRNLGATARVVLQPFTSMRASLGWDAERDLIFPETVVTRGQLGVEAQRNQSFDFNWTPPVASWLTPRYSYASSFARNHSREASRSLDSLDLRDFSVIVSHNATVDLAVDGLLATLFGSAPPPGQPGSAAQPAPPSASWWQRAVHPIRLDRTRQKTVSYVQEDLDPGAAFQLGLGDLDGETGGAPQLFSSNDAWGLASGLNLWRGMQLRGAFRNVVTARRYFTGDNATRTRTWPDLSFRWNAIPLPGWARRVVSTTALTSDFERRQGDNRTNGAVLNDSDRRLWDPLVGLTVVWGNGLTTDLRTVTSTTRSEAIRGGTLDNEREETATDYLFNLNYSIRSGTRLWVPFPTLWGVRLRQPLRTALTVARRYREDATGLTDQPQDVVNLKTATTEVRPSFSYEFGRVTSGFALSYLSRADQKRDITTTTYSMEAFLDFLF